MAGRNKKPQLPKAVLDMKFMRKTKERLQKENANTEDHETSFIFCEELIEGRLSFRGMNPDIERLMELKTVKQENDNGEMIKDIADDILAKKMEAFNKRKRPYSNPSNNDVKRKK